MHSVWPSERAANINLRTQRAFRSGRPRYSVVSITALHHVWMEGYLPGEAELADDLNSTGPEEFIAETLNFGSPPDFIIVTCAGAIKEAELLWDLRQRVGPEPIIALWLWDNHCNPLGNLSCAHAADLVFFSHRFANEGWFNVFQPNSAALTHVPACTAQWSHRQAAEYFEKSLTKPRKHKLLINYVLYTMFSEDRRRILLDYQKGLPDADVFLMSPGDRSRYANLDRAGRFAEWANYKATIIVPLVQDLSTRVFDALLAGLVLIVPNDIPDFDFVIPRDIQAELGILRTDSLEINEIRDLSRFALETYDRTGHAGAMARHTFALENHMLVNRVASMLAMFWLIGTGQQKIVFQHGAKGPALYASGPA
jgi:hypothetical protein